MGKTQKRVLSKVAKMTSPILLPLEKSAMSKYIEQYSQHTPVFIVGAPRTGSTALYQALTNCYDIQYIDNLADLFHRNLYYGMTLSHKIFNQNTHNSFESNFGDTSKSGLHSPSECGEFWYRWLPRDDHYVESHEIKDESKRDMSNYIYSIINKYQKPFLFKNLNAGQRLGLLADVAPNAKFIFIKRNPLYTAQSILRAKQKVKLNPNQWWSIKPKNWREIEKLEAHEQIVKQIFFLEKQIIEDLRKFPENNFMTTDYKLLCNDYTKELDRIATFIGGLSQKVQAASPTLRYSEEQQISNDDFEQFNEEIGKLDWLNYEYE